MVMAPLARRDGVAVRLGAGHIADADGAAGARLFRITID